MRVVSAVDLLSPRAWPQLAPPLLRLIRAIDTLRLELGAATARPLVDSCELQLLWCVMRLRRAKWLP